MHGYSIVMAQSMDVKGGLETVTRKDFTLFTMAEWILGATKSGKYPDPENALLQISEADYTTQLRNFEMRVEAHLKKLAEANAHGCVLREVVQSLANAVDSANVHFEATTLAAHVDLIASGTIDFLPFAFYHDPFQLPVYLATALFSAAMPIQLRRRVGDRLDGEDDAAILEITSHYHAQVQSPSLLEMLVQGELESIVARARMHGVASGEGDQVPVASEHMRRQALALAHELAGLPPQRFEADDGKEKTEAMCDEAVEAARNSKPACLRYLHAKRRAEFSGSARHCQPNSTRAATRDARLKYVVQTLCELNSMLSTGIFRGNDVVGHVTEGDSDDEDGQFVSVPTINHAMATVSETSVRISSVAWRATAKQASLYMLHGSQVLAESCLGANSLLSFPIRPRTLVECGKCNKKFSIYETIGHNRLSQCIGCAKVFCSDCYEETVDKAVKLLNKTPITAQDVRLLQRDHPGLLTCRECVPV